MELETFSDWGPSASLDVLRMRARMLSSIREFFAARGVLEVETPILSDAATTDPHLHSLTTRYAGPGAAAGHTLYLQTSPEFAMKRLLAAGSGSIYQICKVFRDGECGRLHNPEFTMIEWYRTGFDHQQLMNEVADLVTTLLPRSRGLRPAERLSYREAFVRHAKLDPHVADAAAFAACAAEHGIEVTPELARADIDVWRALVLAHVVEPNLGHDRLTFLYDYPVSQAALARVRTGTPPLAARFELYLDGVELANGFHELGDADEQRERMNSDLARRAALGMPPVPPDRRLVAALAHGLPECAGVALGFDRVVMLATGARHIETVIAFPFARA